MKLRNITIIFLISFYFASTKTSSAGRKSCVCKKRKHDTEASEYSAETSPKKRQTPVENVEEHILDMIPLHHIPPVMNGLIQSFPSGDIRQVINSPHFVSLTSGISKAITSQHLGGVVAALGMHMANVVDHITDVSNHVLDQHEKQQESSRDERTWNNMLSRIRTRSAGVWGRQEKKKPEEVEITRNRRMPLQGLGSTLRGLVQLVPAEKTKEFYYKQYEPFVKEMKHRLNSTEFRSMLHNTYTSDYYRNLQSPQRNSISLQTNFGGQSRTFGDPPRPPPASNSPNNQQQRLFGNLQELFALRNR